MVEQNNLVSVVIPCLNEGKFIAKCLDSIINSDYPNGRLEILVVDGMSTDDTREIVHRYERKYDFIKLLDNEKCLTPAALNIGVKNATGDIIVRMDAHTTYSKDYISKSVETLNKFDAANVGGIIKTLPGKDTIFAKAMALSLAHPFGVGESHFRLAKSWLSCRSVDTVPFGCFKRELFDKIGYFNEELHRVEDIDFNKRIKETGGKIILNPEIVSYYYARGNIKDYVYHNFDNGYLVTAFIGKSKLCYSYRHFVPLICFSFLAILMTLSIFNKHALFILLSIVMVYACLSLYFSFKTLLRQKNILMLFLMPVVFALLHLSYGVGSICGLLKSVFSK